MTRRILILLYLIANLSNLNAQIRISGKVVDEKNEPLIGANIYLKGTIEGTSSNIDGLFEFQSNLKSNQILVVSCLGYKNQERKLEISQIKKLFFKMEKEELSLDEIVITASTFSIGKSRTLEKMDPLDVVLTGNSNGDIYAALQSLPGTQKVGEDGKLYIRGGQASETQTFIDGMHVLFPYTTTAENVASRARFSTFLFKGINFSLGGYDSEYGQALSSVLPMETKDVSSAKKLGVNASPLGIGGGGTHAWKNMSLSANFNYSNMSIYNQLFPDEYNWKKEYRSLSGEMQLKTQLGLNTVHKLYFGADRTAFIRRIEDDLNNSIDRDFDLKRDNYYLNSTINSRTKNNYHLFLGTAFSIATGKYINAITVGDLSENKEQEIHIKTKIRKNIFRYFQLSGGLETYIKSIKEIYVDSLNVRLQDSKVNYLLGAAFVNNQFKLKKNLYANLSTRVEFTDLYKKFDVAPRISINYLKKEFQLSAIVGKYYQIQSNHVLQSENSIKKQESCLHYILGGSYNFEGTLLKLELYRKKYRNLALLEGDSYTSAGDGISKGLDCYLNGKIIPIGLSYTLSYSYNDSKRLYQDYPIEFTPTFATKHNVSLSLKYSIPVIKSFLGVTHTYASGRPYHNPNQSGFINSKAKIYNSLDASLTFLLSKKVILYTSLSNLLGRRNEYGYDYSTKPNLEGIYKSKPIRNSRNRFFYVGVFISLKNDSAYDVSNF